MENISRLKLGYEPSEKHDMLSIGTLVNVLWQCYLPGGSLEKNPLLNEVYAYFMGNTITKKRNLHVWPKGQDICWSG
jgi:hypothetical protein